MAPKGKQTKSTFVRRSLQSASSRKDSTTKKTVKLSCKQKKAFLQPYVDELVNLKLKEKKQLGANSYSTTISNLKAVGVKWITLDSLKSKVKRAYAKAVKKQNTPNTDSRLVCSTTPPPPGVLPSDTSRSTQQHVHKKGGRPIGTTIANQCFVQECIEEARNEITDLYYAEYVKVKQSETQRDAFRSFNERVTKGTYHLIHSKVVKDRNLPKTFNFPYDSCKKRIKRRLIDSINPDYNNRKSPLHKIEPHIITLLIALSDSGNPLTVGNALPLINSLIHGTPYQQKLILWKKQHKLNYDNKGKEMDDNELGTVGVSYWRLFLKRHKNILTTNKGRLFELNRTNWTHYRNFRDMYVNVESHMVDAKVAMSLPFPAWMDKQGNIVDEVDSYGMKVNTLLTHPSCCLSMDETGGDTNMMGDGAAGGEKYVGRKGQAVKRPAGKKAKKYTTIGLTGLDGKPAMCILIFAGVKRNILMETGVDTSLFGDGSNLDLDDDQANLEFFNENYGKGKLFPGGPTCNYKDKTVPCMVRYSPSGGITPDILTDILRTMDDLGVFEKEREEGIRPFLLLDGHQSRFSVPFLEYITNPGHPWKVCIGVPYGTALWQIGDSIHQNGRYKMRTAMRKKIILRKRIAQMVAEIEILPSDIIPIVNYAWNHSFADVKGTKEAIVQRGWFPLNKNLLLLEEIRNTMTPDDHDWESRSEIYPENRIKLERQKKIRIHHYLH